MIKEAIEIANTYDVLPGEAVDLVEAIFDEVLPQVSTVQALEALPDRTILAYGSTKVYKWQAKMQLLQNVHEGYDYNPEDVLFPLTVVWQP